MQAIDKVGTGHGQNITRKRLLYSGGTMKPAANDPSMDPVITFAIRYLRPIALAGMVFAIGFIAWALSL